MAAGAGHAIHETTAGWVADYCIICHDIREHRIVRLTVAENTHEFEARCGECGVPSQADLNRYAGVAVRPAGDAIELMKETFPYLPAFAEERIAVTRAAIEGSLPPPERLALIREPFLHVSGAAPRPVHGLLIAAVSMLAGVVLAAPILALLEAWGQPWTIQGLASRAVLLVLSMLLSAVAAWPLIRALERRRAQRALTPLLSRALRPLRPTLAEMQAVSRWLAMFADDAVARIDPERLYHAVCAQADRSLLAVDSVNIHRLAAEARASAAGERRVRWDELPDGGEA